MFKVIATQVHKRRDIWAAMQQEEDFRDLLLHCPSS